MAGIRAWRMKNGAVPFLKDYFVRASQTIDEMDPLALGSNTTTQRVYKATSAEIDFLNSAAVTGLLGLIQHNIVTDANGNITQYVPSTIDPGAVVIYPAPSYSTLIPRGNQALIGTTPDIGNTKVMVLVFTDEVEFLIDVCGSANAATTVNRTLIGTSIGLQVNSGVYKADASVTSGTAGGCTVVDVDETQPNFNVSANVSNAIWVSVKQTVQQIQTGLLY